MNPKIKIRKYKPEILIDKYKSENTTRKIRVEQIQTGKLENEIRKLQIGIYKSV